MCIYTFCRIFSFYYVIAAYLSSFVRGYLLNSKSFTFLSMSEENIKLFNSLFLE